MQASARDFSMRAAPTSRVFKAVAGLIVAAALVAQQTPAQAATAAVIEIRGEISKGLGRYIDRALADAESRADVAVFDINTPGGRVDAMREIVNLIFDASVPTIAYVHTEAISAGSVIALACDQIVMAPGSTIGDAAPVSQSGEELGEKVISYIRGTIRATAERNGRNAEIAEAMVDKKKVLVKTGDLIEALTPAEYAQRQEAGVEMEVISPEGELLTLTTQDAMRLGFVEHVAATLDDVLAGYSIVDDHGDRRVMTDAQIEARRAASPDAADFRVVESLEDADTIHLKRDFLETLAIAVTGSMLGSLLLSIGMVGIFIEIRTPGFGIPGILGLLCIGLFFGGHMIAEAQTSFGLIAFIVGLALLALEVFVIPGFGVAGISGIILCLGGLLFVFGQSAPTLSAAVTSFSISVTLTLALAIVVAMTLPRTRAWNRLILSTQQTSAEGYQTPRHGLTELIGHAGVAVTTLRPSGTIEIDVQRYDVVSDSEFIAKDTPVTVVQVEGGRVVVRPRTSTQIV